MKPIYWGLGFLVAGVLVSCSYISRTTVDGVSTCTATDYSKIAFGLLAAGAGVAAFRNRRLPAVLLIAAGLALTAVGFNAGGLLCR